LCSALSSWSADSFETNVPITWPPWNPISTRTDSPLATCNHLRENAVDGIWMDECDLQPEHPLPRLGVDQLGAGGGEVAESLADVVDPVGDVMQAGAPLGEELAHRRVVAEGREELDPAVADAHGRRLDPLLLDARPMLDLSAEEALVRRHGLLEVGDGETDVMDPACLHGGDRM